MTKKHMTIRRCEAIAWYMIAAGRFTKTEVLDMLEQGYLQSATGIEFSDNNKEMIVHKTEVIVKELKAKAARKCEYAFPDANI